MTHISSLIVEYTGHREDYQKCYYDTLSRIFTPINETILTRILGPFDAHLPPGSARGLENRVFWTPYDRPGSTFTDPKRFDPNKFQFIVHVIGAGAPHLISNANKEFGSRLLSCSIINPSKTTTFIFDFGFILKVPESNIYATTPCDMFLHNKEIAKGKACLDLELTRVNSKFGISTPKEILESSHPTKINELAVLGKGVTVIGVFRKVLGDKPRTKGPLYPKFETYAKTHEVPIVDIPISYMTPKQKSKKKETKAKPKTPAIAQDSFEVPRKGKKGSKSKQAPVAQQEPKSKMKSKGK